MNQPLTTIREALEHSFFIGIHSDLPWFTNLQHRALRALDAIEKGGDNGTPVIAAHTEAVCTWPPGECDE